MEPHVSSNDYAMSVSDVADYIESITGRRPASANVYRWIRKGVGGVWLKAHRLGARYYTGRTAVDAFLRESGLAQHRRSTSATSTAGPLLKSGLQDRVDARQLAIEARTSRERQEEAKQFLEANVFRFLMCC